MTIKRSDQAEIPSSPGAYGVEIGASSSPQTTRFVDRRDRHFLRGRRGSETYLKMLQNDALLAGAYGAYNGLARRVSWSTVAADESPESANALAVLRRSLDNLNWHEFVSDSTLAGPLGYAAFELNLRVADDGVVEIESLAPRPQESIDAIEVDAHARMISMKQILANRVTPVEIPAWKICHVKFLNNRGDPRGRPWFRSCYRSSFFVEKLEDIEGVGIERELSGLPVMRVPEQITLSTASPAEKARYAEAKEIVAAVRANEYGGLVIPAELSQSGSPTGWGFSLLTSGGQRAIDIDKGIRRHGVNSLIALRSEWLMLGVIGARGTSNVADTKVDLFEMSVEAGLDAIEDAFNCQVVPILMQLNGIDPAVWPKRVHGMVETPNLNQLADYVSKLVAATGRDGRRALEVGPELQRHLREFATIPAEEADFLNQLAAIGPEVVEVALDDAPANGTSANAR